MEPELHVVLGMEPDAYDQAMDEGRRTHNWEGMSATKDPRWHSHPLLGITGHAHSSVEDARRYHGHKPELAWNHEPVFVDGDLPRTTGVDIDWEAGCWEGTRRDWEREQMDRAGDSRD